MDIEGEENLQLRRTDDIISYVSETLRLNNYNEGAIDSALALGNALKFKHLSPIIQNGAYLMDILKKFPNKEQEIKEKFGILNYDLAKELCNAPTINIQENILHTVHLQILFRKEFAAYIAYSKALLENIYCVIEPETNKFQHAFNCAEMLYCNGSINHATIVLSLFVNAIIYANDKNTQKDIENKIIDFLKLQGHDENFLKVFTKNLERLAPEGFYQEFSARKKEFRQIIEPGCSDASTTIIVLVDSIDKLRSIQRRILKEDKKSVKSCDFWNEYASFEDVYEHYAKIYNFCNKSLCQSGRYNKCLAEFCSLLDTLFAEAHRIH